MRFEFATATRILFGPGAVQELPNIARQFGARALLVAGPNRERVGPILSALETAGVETSNLIIDSEPTLAVVREGVHLARDGCDFILGFGGGSAIDTAKAVAALTTNSGEPLDYLEVIGKGHALENPPLPFIAIPTTAGTGAEVTRNAVLGSPEHGIKASLRSPLLLAKVAVVDPDLTLNLPPRLTASTGLDALTQLIEPYVSKRANPMADVFCREGMQRVSRCLVPVFSDGENRAARESMSFASLLGGLALANAGLGVIHGFAGVLGGMLGAPHGALCAALLPHGIAINIRALRKRTPEHVALQKYSEVARILMGDSEAEAEDSTLWVSALCDQLRVAPLRSHGLKHSQIPELVEKTEKASSTKANPIALTSEELTEIAERAL